MISEMSKERKRDMGTENKAPMSFSEFEKTIKEIQKDEEYLSQLSQMGMNLFEHLGSTSITVRLLEKIFMDKSEWISWWIWEKDFGTKDEMQAFNKDRTIIPLSTVRELYDFLVEEMKNSETTSEIPR